MKIKYTLSLLLIALLLVCCSEENYNKPYGSNATPEQVSNIKITNRSGSAVIHYDRPDDANTKYVKALYSPNKDGVIVERLASYYTDSIMLDGFKTAEDYTVQLVSVSYGESQSEPVEVVVSPSIPPYLAILEQMEVKATFGGLSLETTNETEAKLILGILKHNEELEDWEEVHTEYFSREKLSFAVRGQISEEEQEAGTVNEAKFGIYARDRWGHVSDTVVVALTPWLEYECDKKLFKHYPLPSDTHKMHTWGGSQTAVSALWDGITQNMVKCFHTTNNDVLPQWFTLDLGQAYSFSRLTIHWRASTTASDGRKFIYQGGSPKMFELWGSNDPSPSGEYDDSWTLIKRYEVLRPSGLLGNAMIDPLTADDLAIISTGQDFDIPLETGEYRYIRFKTMETWGNIPSVMMNELTFYGGEAGE